MPDEDQTPTPLVARVWRGWGSDILASATRWTSCGDIMAINTALSNIFKSKYFLPTITAIVVLAILGVDTIVDVDIDISVLYVVVVFLALRFCSPRGVVIVALCCAVLSAVGWALSPGNLSGVNAIVNRLLSCLALGFVTFFGLRDRAAHIALQEVWGQLARVNRVTTVGGLTASVAHEIKQPLTGIITNANTAVRWLAMQPADLNETHQALERIIRDGYRASGVIDRILALAQPPMRKEQSNLNEIVAETVQLSRSELQKNLVSVETMLAKDLSPIVGDPVQLQQVLLNLIQNSIDAMKESNERQHELMITSTNASNGVLVLVRDSGKGLNENDLAHLFDAFYTSKPGGMGLGLAISRLIIENHSGRLWATPNKLRGATFHVWLPVDREAASDQGAPQSQSDRGPSPIL